MTKGKIVLPESPEAASIQTVTGWVSRLGHFFGQDERTARYDGCTHRKCEKCGGIIGKHDYCRPCHAKAEIEKYEKMERKPWNGTDALYSQADDLYFFDAGELDQYCEDEEVKPESLRLIICVPTHAHTIDPNDYYCDDLPEDGELPDDIAAAFQELNDAIRESKSILSWSPGKFAADFAEVKP